MNRCLNGLHYNQRAVLFMAIIALLILPPPIFSQDNTPTDTPTATFSETPSQTPTYTETATPSEMATSTVVPTETATPSQAVVETATPTPLETPAATAGTVVPSLTPFSIEADAQLFVAQACNPIPNPIPNGDVACLRDAILVANGSGGACPGSGTVINLATNGLYSITDTVTTAFDNTLPPGNSYGANGLPAIRCTVTINGNGSIIERFSSAPSFRVMGVGQGGNLTLNDVTVRGGMATATGGAGVLNITGYVTINRSRFTNNVLSFTPPNGTQIVGAGIYSYNGQFILQYSEIDNNSNTISGNSFGDGGGVGAVGVNFIQVIGSNFHDNSTTRDGHDLFVLNYNYDPAISFLNNSCIEQNAGIRIYAHDQASPAAVLNGINNWWGTTNASAIAAMVNKVNYTPFAGSLIPCGPAAALTPTPTPVPTIPGIIAELATYGVIADSSGVPSGVQYTAGSGIPWTLDELQQVLIGVRNTADAFYRLKYGAPSATPGTSPQEKALFLSVMDTPDSVNPTLQGFYLLRVNNDFQYGNDAFCDSADTANEACTSNGNSAIGLYGQFYQPGNVSNIQLTLVHEFGHRFNNQSAIGQGVQSLENRLGVSTQTIFDCGPNGNGTPPPNEVLPIVFGQIGNNWVRGQRGWGSIATNPPTGFQQDPANTVTEAAADMFLNWVYRRITDSPPTWQRCNGPATNNWSGFLNIDANGNTDLGEPGNIRYWWMELQMTSIFTEHSWQ